MEEGDRLGAVFVTAPTFHCADEEGAVAGFRLLPLVRCRIADVLCYLKVHLCALTMNRSATWLASCENQGV